MRLHAQIIEENGKPKFALLPIGEYEALLNELSEFDSLEDLADYLTAMKAKEETQSWHALEDVKAQLAIK